MWTIATKEFEDLLYNPKFLLTFAVSTVLILISIFSGYAVYKGEHDYMAETEISAMDRMKAELHLSSFGHDYTAVRYPDKLSIFNIGISGTINRKALVIEFLHPRFTENRYEADPLLAVFSELDLTFTVTYFLSLFAILFSFGSISGEREAGTLRLLLSGSTGRPSVILGKLVGGYIPIALLFLLPFLLGLISLMILTDINFSGEEWGKIALMSSAFLLYLLLFYTMGLAMSSLTRNSFISFMFCLLFWVFSAAILPKGAVQMANLITPTMNSFEHEKKLRNVSRVVNDEQNARLAKFFRENRTRENYREKLQEFYGKMHEEMEEKRKNYEERLISEFARSRKMLLETAVSVARISPSSSLSFIINCLSNTGPQMLENFEREILAFNRTYAAYRKTTGGSRERLRNVDQKKLRGYEVVTGADGNASVKLYKRVKYTTDISGMPRFKQTPLPLEYVTNDTLSDFAVLGFYSILFVAVAYVAFLRYDVR